MIKIIGICGLIGSGKDTAADYLVQEFGFRRDSFAATLKDAVAAIFCWDRELLEGRTKQAREWREQIDPWWAKKLNLPKLTPRWVLQYWGTEVCRHAFHDDIWIASLEARLRNTKDSIVISDCRFPNETRAIKEQNGCLVWIQRGALPWWYDIAVKANQGHQLAQQTLLSHDVHASETAWIGTNFDCIIDNNGTVDQLYLQLRTVVLQSTN